MPWPTTPLTEQLHLRYPIIQAPMTGGITTPPLVAAVANAGGLGTLAGSDLEPDSLRATIAAVRELTDQPFAVNLIIPEAVHEDSAQLERALQLLAPFRVELDLPAAPLPTWQRPNFFEQLAVLLEAQVPIVSFTGGVPRPEAMATLKQAGIITLGTATHLLEAITLEESGIDLVIAQGAEAGGPRATFVGPPEKGLVGTLVLLPTLVDYLRIPVIAAGGIMDGRGITAALALGAAGVQLGTAFLACSESGAHPRYKALVTAGTEIATTLSRAFSGKLGRGLDNRLIRTLQAQATALPGFPIQQQLVQELSQAALAADQPELVALWAGQGCGLCQRRPAAELLLGWVAQVGDILAEYVALGNQEDFYVGQ